jgi:multiple sugar transport system permease protein
MSQVPVHRAARRQAAPAPVAGARGLGRPRSRRPYRRVITRLAWFVVMLAFTAFFVVPVIWLLIAPTKTDHQLVFEGPFTFGSFHTFLQTWDALYRC